MEADATIIGVVLAGGAGARVGGEDKGLLPLAGKPLIEHGLCRLGTQCARLLIVANRNLDAYAGYAPVVHDPGAGHAGPLAGLLATFGLLAANRHALPKWLLTVPVDCPDPPDDLAERLRAALVRSAAARCACVRQAGQLQPLFALYRVGADPAAWQASARTAFDAHGSPLRWLESLGAVPVDFSAAGGAFHNLNTPADFRDFERTHGYSRLPDPHRA